MATRSTCLNCGAPLVGGKRQEFCPKCLFLQASAGLLGPALTLSVEDQESEVSDLVGGPGGASASGHRKSEVTNRFGDYELLEEIGRGGMGVVYRARQRSLNRMVAVKMMAFGPGSSAELVKRFRAEAVSAASLHHPNIVAIHEVGIHEDRHFFVMDYVEGQSLAQRISDLRFRISDFKQSARWMKTVAEAVHYAHKRGILHRDLKPSNVLIDAQDQPHVVDFGLARQLEGDSELTVTGQVLGSPQYLPPEQAAGQRGRVSRRTDVYALGATLYHLLTGRPPFQAESLAQTLDLVLHAEPVAPRLLSPSVPVDLETICLKCLEKEPACRYPTAQDLAEELTRFLADEPIYARPLGPAGKAWRWCRRKPQLASLAAVAVLAVLLGFAGVLWQWRRAEAHRGSRGGRSQRRPAQPLCLGHILSSASPQGEQCGSGIRAVG
ncbi:MAG: serine/threonine-protein kinase [Verrucomicrobiia bacterium]